MDKENIKKIFKLALQYHQQNNLVEAEKLYNDVLKIDPRDTAVLVNLGVLLYSSKNYEKAKDLFEKVIVINPDLAEAHHNLGRLFGDNKKYQKAISCYENAIKIKPNYIDAYFNLGLAYQELDQFQKAKKCYEKIVEIDPEYEDVYNNLGVIHEMSGEYEKAIKCFKKKIEFNPKDFTALSNLANIYITQQDDSDKTIGTSYKALKIYNENSSLISKALPLFRLKHDVQQAQYLISKDYKLEGIKEFQKIGSEILTREENKENQNNSNQKILLTSDEINSLLPFYKSDHVYKPKKISGSCINPNKNWQDVEDEYFNSSNQIMYIDNFLSEEALEELRKFCLMSKVWNREYKNKYLGAFGDQGFISLIHLQIAIDLKQKLPKLFGPHRIRKFWGFKYDSKLGKGINVHADFAIHNLNFWITPDEYNNNKNSGGLKVYDAPAPDNWTFKDYNRGNDKIYEFLKDNKANCTNVPYKCNRAVLFNSAYFHETDEIDFKDEYVGRRVNNTYLFGNRLVK